MIESREVHISSMVVHAAPHGLESVKENIRRLRGAEIHGESEHGKLVVVLESDSQSQITDVVERINGFAHVLGTALVYHQIESLEPQGTDPS
jgi:nitrate reductase NapD